MTRVMRICKVMNCGDKYMAKGYCVVHYGRYFRHGDPLKVQPKLQHGLSKSVEYKTWVRIKQRCYNPNTLSYAYYGGRGIKVCTRWLKSFDDFLADMGQKPSPKHSIDRINVMDNYEPSNCRWATQSQQMRNRRPPQKMLPN